MRTSLLACLALWLSTQPAAAQQAAAPADRPATTDAACFPACRPGFLCHQGACISACNPHCPQGQVCTAQATCELDRGLSAAAPSAPPSTSEQQRQAALERRERIRAFRRAHRLDGLPTVDGWMRVHVVGGHDAPTPRPAVLSTGLAGGYAKNLTRYFGVLMRGVVGLGGAALNSSFGVGTRRESDRALFYSVEGELVTYFGPLGNFYLGPMLWTGVYGYSQRQVTAQDGDTFRTPTRMLGGVGAAAGLFLGHRRNVHLSWFLKSSLTNWMPVQFGVGLGYRFGLGNGPID